MPQPTASAPPEASPAAAPQFYRWEVAGKPLSIEIRLDMVERLDQEVVRTFRSVTSRGSEIGGLLLGHVRQGPRPVVVIEDYELVPCDYQRGPLYLLTDEDRQRLEQALTRWRREPPTDLHVVGYFRSNTRKELQLDDEDVATLRQYFADPLQVCLLIKPFASKANLAGFFLWEGGEPQRRSDLTFAFNRAELAKGVTASGSPTHTQPAAPSRAGTTQPVVSGDVRTAGSSSLPGTDSPAAQRPTIEVRIALVEPAGGTTTSGAPAAPPSGEHTRAPELRGGAAEAEATGPARDGKPVEGVLSLPSDGEAGVDGRPRADEGRTRTESSARPSRLLIPAEEPSATQPAAEERTPEPVRPARIFEGGADIAHEPAARSKRSLLLIGLAGIVVIGLVGIAMWNFSRGGAPAAQPEVASLNLRVERSGGQLLLSWNRSLPLIQTAQRAILSISDGDHREDVEMDLGQLRTGSIVYSPITSDVSFRLEVTDLKNGKSVSESVRVLGGRPSPSGPPVESTAGASESQPAAEAARSQRQPARAMAPIPRTDRRESLAARLSPVEPIPAGAPPLTELPVSVPSVPQPTAEASGRAAAEPPAASTPPPARVIESAGSQTAQALPATSQAAAPTSPAPPAQPAKPGASAEPPVTQAQSSSQQAQSVPRIGGQVQEARLIRRREPVYPPLARQARIQGVVRLEAVIGPDGRVEKVQAISGPPLLRQAAVDAVKDWIYEPCRLNGQPVRVTTQIEINFTLGR